VLVFTRLEGNFFFSQDNTELLLKKQNNNKVTLVEARYLEYSVIINYDIQLTKFSIDFYNTLKLHWFVG